ncbi:PP2C family protein-serine/threonine phosphatase [Ekhidna sp. To15]|uniref:PP2C family protein-serine/threonine phosphatase n=1 Tax=Ekhidna sp. To15 TaxID=3395267 RepID=UPI003F5268B4
MSQSKLLKQRATEVEWEEELKKTTVKYHIAGSWVAVIFNLIFGATDYINVNHHFEVFFIFRLAVSSLTAIILVFRKPLNISADFLIFVPFLLISIQNAFMWSLMDADLLQKHTLAYIALFIGAGMLVLWRIYWSIIVVVISIASNFYFLIRNSTLGVEEILASGGLLTGTVMIFSIILIQTRYNLTKREIISRLSLKESNKILNQQKKIIESKNKDITSSIRYAKKIQEAILPSDKSIKKYLPNSFVFYRPRDIVSGDFYWFKHEDDVSYIAAVDCTGHGVPGAFMSMIGNTILNKIAPEKTQPAEILNSMRKEVIDTMEQGQESAQRDGMDIALCTINHRTNMLEYAGAFNPLCLFRDNELIEIKADRMPIGSYFGKIDKKYTNHSIELKAGDTFFIYSDGFQDQIGGPNDRKYSSKQFKSFLQSIAQEDSNEQLQRLKDEIEKWQGKDVQLDDMLIIGVKV